MKWYNHPILLDLKVKFELCLQSNLQINLSLFPKQSLDWNSYLNGQSPVSFNNLKQEKFLLESVTQWAALHLNTQFLNL